MQFLTTRVLQTPQICVLSYVNTIAKDRNKILLQLRNIHHTQDWTITDSQRAHVKKGVGDHMTSQIPGTHEANDNIIIYNYFSVFTDKLILNLNLE